MTRGLLRFLMVAAVLGIAFQAHRSGWARDAILALEDLGPAAVPLFVALHAATVIAFVPSVVPNLAAGALFGFALGFPLSIAGAGLGAIAAFGIGRTLARNPVEAAFRGHRTFQGLAVAVRERGWRVVALARLTPIFPFAVGNYGFGLTRISGRDYLFASALGTMPSNAVYVYLGALAGSLAAATSGQVTPTPLRWGLLALGLLATLALTLQLRRLAKRALAVAISEETASPRRTAP